MSPTCTRSLCEPRSLRILGEETHHARTKGISQAETLQPRYMLYGMLEMVQKLQQDCSKQYQAEHQDIVNEFYLKSLCWLKTVCQHWLKRSA